MRTRFEPSVAWLEPFFEAAKDLIPARKLQRVMGYRVPLTKEHKSEAMCSQITEDGKTFFVISLAINVHYNMPNTQCGHCKQWKKKSLRRMAGYTLRDFAHELAHTKHMEHTPEHWDLEARISRRFTKVLKKLNIKDIGVRRPLKERKNG